MNLWHLLCGKYAFIYKDELHSIREESRINKGLWEQANQRNQSETWLDGYYAQKLTRENVRLRREIDELRKKHNE